MIHPSQRNVSDARAVIEAAERPQARALRDACAVALQLLEDAGAFSRPVALSCADLARAAGVCLRTAKEAFSLLREWGQLVAKWVYRDGRRLTTEWRRVRPGAAMLAAMRKAAADKLRALVWAKNARRAQRRRLGASQGPETYQPQEYRETEGARACSASVKPQAEALSEEIRVAWQCVGAARPGSADFWRACDALEGLGQGAAADVAALYL